MDVMVGSTAVATVVVFDASLQRIADILRACA
jgi:hypothetical protein